MNPQTPGREHVERGGGGDGEGQGQSQVWLPLRLSTWCVCVFGLRRNGVVMCWLGQWEGWASGWSRRGWVMGPKGEKKKKRNQGCFWGCESLGIPTRTVAETELLHCMVSIVTVPTYNTP